MAACGINDNCNGVSAMISDILSFKGFAGWTCGEDYASLTWDAAAAGRDKPTEAEIAAWKDDKDAAQ